MLILTEQRSKIVRAVALLALISGAATEAHAVIRDARIPATDARMIKWITAARDGDVATVKTLVQGGMDINARDDNGDPALSWAAYHGRKDVVDYLLERGADATLKNTSGRWGANHTPLLYAAAGGHRDLVQRFYDGLDPKAKADKSFDGVANFGLRVAAANRRVELMDFFLRHGADVNVTSAAGRTALMEATVSLDEKVIQWLLDRGGDVTVRDREGVTALHEAARRGWRTEMVRLILDKGADINARTAKGETPLAWARQSGANGAVTLLLSRGAVAEGETKPAAKKVPPPKTPPPAPSPSPPPPATRLAAPTVTAGAVPAGMALIPAGKFKMGDPFEREASDQVPVHTVHVSAFLIDRQKVTGTLWNEVRSWGQAHGYTDLSATAKAADHPVHSLTWYDAVKWCNARSEKEGLTPVYYTGPNRDTVYRTGKRDIANDCVRWEADGYRLPTEAEWEKAARGGVDGRRFPWGDTITHQQANYNSGGRSGGQVPSYDLNPTRGNPPQFTAGKEPYTSPVGSFPPNDYGLGDMAGNAWDWVWDWYRRDYYRVSPNTDPKGPEQAQATDGAKVLRGGSWYFGADLLRCSMRGNNRVPDTRTQNIGFRCVRRR